jgi:PAS domain S-box-containing protein
MSSHPPRIRTDELGSLARYGVAIALTVAAMVARLPVQPVLGTTVPFLFVYPAVFLSAYVGGFGPGLLATLLGAVVTDYWLIEPLNAFGRHDLPSAIGLVVFLLSGLFVSWVGERYHAARRRAAVSERALRRSESIYLRILDSGMVGVLFWDESGRIADANDAFLALVGYSREDLEADRVDWRAMTMPTWSDADDVALGQLHENGYTPPFEKEYVARDGTRVPVLVSATTLDDAASGIAFVLDMTSLKKTQAERDELLAREQAARRQAEEANRLKDEFLATISHELRTPLNAMLGWARLLRSGRLDGAEAGRAVEIIERNTISQAQLIEDLLDLSRVVSGKMRLDVRDVHLAEVVEAAVESLRLAAEARSVRVQKVLDPKAGPVSGDPERLQQVVWNLVSNAIKFTPKGGRVHVRLERVHSRVELTVSDTGEGIAPAFLPHVFDRFRQAEGSTARRVGGLGLGLAIARHLVEMHGGTITVHSDGEGQGATFRVALPLRAVTSEAFEANRIHPTAAAAPPLDLSPTLGGLRVMVVDDEPDTRDVLDVTLTYAGAEVRTFGSGREVLDALEDWRPDVIVSDIGMPDMDGYELIERVRTLPAGQGGDVLAIALTAYARVEDRVKALAAGYQMHVAKPVEPVELIASVARLAESRR